MNFILEYWKKVFECLNKKQEMIDSRGIFD